MTSPFIDRSLASIQATRIASPGREPKRLDRVKRPVPFICLMAILSLTYPNQALYISLQGDRRCHTRFLTNPIFGTRWPLMPTLRRGFGGTGAVAHTVGWLE